MVTDDTILAARTDNVCRADRGEPTAIWGEAGCNARQRAWGLFSVWRLPVGKLTSVEMAVKLHQPQAFQAQRGGE